MIRMLIAWLISGNHSDAAIRLLGSIPPHPCWLGDLALEVGRVHDDSKFCDIPE